MLFLAESLEQGTRQCLSVSKGLTSLAEDVLTEAVESAKEITTKSATETANAALDAGASAFGTVKPWLFEACVKAQSCCDVAGIAECCGHGSASCIDGAVICLQGTSLCLTYEHSK